jgi:ABC-type multidrug transport system fused ATPase/permease subunit
MAGEISTHISGDTILIRTGIGEKLGMFVNAFATFVTGFVIGFSKNWELSLVILTIVRRHHKYPRHHACSVKLIIVLPSPSCVAVGRLNGTLRPPRTAPWME